ncbi:MAG: hypothetical protein P1U63_12060 [Coxiellaceae bacterium]|nr:hypothetical protein [Coxiellaceae bacterium]
MSRTKQDLQASVAAAYTVMNQAMPIQANGVRHLEEKDIPFIEMQTNDPHSLTGPTLKTHLLDSRLRAKLALGDTGLRELPIAMQQLQSNRQLRAVLKHVPDHQVTAVLKAAVMLAANPANVEDFRLSNELGQKLYDAENKFDDMQAGNVLSSGLCCCCQDGSCSDCCDNTTTTSSGYYQMRDGRGNYHHHHFYSSNASNSCLTDIAMADLMCHIGDSCDSGGGHGRRNNDSGEACLVIAAVVAVLATIWVTTVSLVACTVGGCKTMESATDSQGRPDSKYGRKMKYALVASTLAGAAYLLYGTGMLSNAANGISNWWFDKSFNELESDQKTGVGFASYGYLGIVGMVTSGVLSCCILGACAFRCSAPDPSRLLNKQGGNLATALRLGENQKDLLKQSGVGAQLLALYKVYGQKGLDYAVASVEAVKLAFYPSAPPASAYRPPALAPQQVVVESVPGRPAAYAPHAYAGAPSFAKDDVPGASAPRLG